MPTYGRNSAISIIEGRTSIIRSTSAVIAADSATLTVANFPVVNGFSSRSYDSILVGVEITAGTNPTMTIEALIYDQDAPDGNRWKRIPVPVRLGGDGSATQTTGALASGATFAELITFGAAWMCLRVTAVTNSGSTTASKILAMPGAYRGRI